MEEEEEEGSERGEEREEEGDKENHGQENIFLNLFSGLDKSCQALGNGSVREFPSFSWNDNSETYGHLGKNCDYWNKAWLRMRKRDWA